MANQQNLINAFDDCIERLSTGENLDDILKDYPDSADYLRDLLMIGERLSEVHNAVDESTSAQSRGRDKLQIVLKEKPKRKRIGRPFWYMPTIAAGIVMLFIGAGFLTLVLNSNRTNDLYLNTTRTSLAPQVNSTTESLIRETQAQATSNAQSTQVAYVMSTPTPAPYEENFDITATALFMPTMTLVGSPIPPTLAPIDPQTVITTSVASMEQATVPSLIYGTGDPDFPALTVTTQAQVYAQMTATNLSTLFGNGSGGSYDYDEADMTATAEMNERILEAQMTGDPLSEMIDPTPTVMATQPSAIYAADMTATALIGIFDVTPESNVGVSGGFKTTTTPPAPSFPDSGDGNGTNNALKITSTLDLSATSTMRPTVTGTPTPAPTQTFAPQGTQVADGSLVIPSPNNDIPTPFPALIPLNAGEIDDNEEWDTYLLYRREFMARGIPVYDIDVTGRQIIKVMDETGQPVLGATVRVFANDVMIAETLTYATGKTLFLPNADERSRGVIEFFVIVEKNGVSQQFILNLTDRQSWDVTLPITVNRDAVKLDVLFLIDTTGSMADEILQLQNNILHISSQINKLNTAIDIRYGLVAYRDFQDEYVTQISGFVRDVAQFQTGLNQLSASGGGDTPEALNTALDITLNQMDWRDENTIKLIFLIADAEPHINHPLEPITYDQSIQDALARGIKIHPIASSGLEPRGEFIFRQIAQVTMGHFLFLTYDNGIEGTVGDVRPELEVGLPDSLDPIGGYTVDRLADVVLRLIQDEILTFRGMIQP